MNRLNALLLALCLLLSACGSVPPAPIDHFYRLQATPVSAATKAFSGAIAVLPFRADSLYAERPIVYAEEANLRQLRQYHYHLWLYAPAQMVQRHLVASLGTALDLSGDSTAANVLEGRVVGFERVLAGKNSKAVVALELTLTSSGKTRLSKTYQAEQLATDDSLGAFAVAMEQALAKIYAEFLVDLTSR
jgi:ABC-type uncharacterized transport system auxiliary subunit